MITEAVPLDQEPIDWFLFDFQKGFCNYYATSQIILLRSLGIPARIAYGYAQGELLEGTTTYNVHQYDAHAWPEVFFPNLGWVEFDPTVSQPDIIRPLGVDPNTPLAESQEVIPPFDPNQNPIVPQPGDDEESISQNEERKTSVLLILGIAGLLVVIIVLVIPIVRKKRLRERLQPVTIIVKRTLRRFGIQPPRFIKAWAYHSSLTPIGKAYEEINQGIISPGGETRNIRHSCRTSRDAH